MTRSGPFTIAAAQLAPVFLDASATIDKACSAIAEAARHGARLIAFPEAFVPGFPVWAALATPIETERLFERYAANSLLTSSPDMAMIRAAARAHSIIVSLGFNEGTTASVGCLWNSNVLIDENGAILNHHRKLVPTFYEKLIWTPGDGAGLRVVETGCGRVGALICGENVNPLARYALIAQGEQIHISSWPSVWPTRDPSIGPGLDMSKALKARASTHSSEAKSFTVAVAASLDETARRTIATLSPKALDILDSSSRALSVVVDPSGQILAEMASNDEGILYADVDLARCVAPKAIQDFAGQYNRFDVFTFEVNRKRLVPAVFLDEGQGQAGAPHQDLETSESRMPPCAMPELKG